MGLVEPGISGCPQPGLQFQGRSFHLSTRPRDKVYRIGLDGQTQVYLADAAQAEGLAIGPKDELYTVSSKTDNLMTYDASGHGSVYASGLPGRYVLARPDGSLYVTAAAAQPGEGSGVWLVKNGAKTLVASGLKEATGLACRPDQWLLAVADGASKWLYSYQITPDGSLINRERYFPLFVDDWDDDAGAGSVCYSQEGHLLIATRSGIQACAANGPVQVVLPMPDRSRVVWHCPRRTGSKHPLRFLRRQDLEAGCEDTRHRRLLAAGQARTQSVVKALGFCVATSRTCCRSPGPSE